MSNTEREPFTAGAAEAARLVQQVQDLGFQAARTIVERFGEIFAQFAASNGVAGPARQEGGGPAAGVPGWDGSMRGLQSDMQRAADTYVAILGQLNEAGLRFLDATRWSESPGADQHDLQLPDVAPGGRVSARLWLHNTTAAPARELRPWCPGLASHAGASFPATALTCAPGRIDRLDPGANCEILVTLTAGDDVSPGAYHGQILVDGLPDVVFALRARVLAAADRS